MSAPADPRFAGTTEQERVREELLTGINARRLYLYDAPFHRAVSLLIEVMAGANRVDASALRTFGMALEAAAGSDVRTEREACALVAETWANAPGQSQVQRDTARTIADAIRARIPEPGVVVNVPETTEAAQVRDITALVRRLAARVWGRK